MEQVLKPVLELHTSDENLLKLDNINEVMIYKLFIEPILNKKIVTILIEGETGSGKSMLSLALAERIEQVFTKIKGHAHAFDPEKQVIYIPTEYGDKLDDWTKSKYVTMVVDELRFLVPKQKWQSLLNQSIAETNAVIRAVKLKSCGYGGIIIYNTQDISDITKDVRKTINYDIIISRGAHARAHIYQFWLDKSNVEKPTLRYRKASFSIGGIRFRVDKLLPVLPSGYVRRKFEEISIEAKSKILRRKREVILNELRGEMGDVRALADELQNDQIFDMVKDLAKWRKDKVTFSTEKKRVIMKLFSLTSKQFKNDFIPAFMEEAKRRGLL